MSLEVGLAALAAEVRRLSEEGDSRQAIEINHNFCRRIGYPGLWAEMALEPLRTGEMLRDHLVNGRDGSSTHYVEIRHNRRASWTIVIS